MRKSILVFCFLALIALACTSSQILQPRNPFEQTRAALIDTATAYAFIPSQEATVFQTVDPSIDPFSLTATSIVATATAQVFVLDTACKNLHVITHFYYSDANNYQEPLVYDLGHGPYLCDSNWNPPFRYEIVVDNNPLYLVPESRLIQILEDAVSRLPDYPPFDGNTSAEVQVISYLMRGTMWYGSFSYSGGIAAYESSLRGADLASALGMEGIDLTATVVLQQQADQEAAEQAMYAMQLTGTAEVMMLPTLNNDQKEVVHQTQSSVLQTVAAYATDVAVSSTTYYLNMTESVVMIAAGTKPYDLTVTSVIATATAQPEFRHNYGLTATSWMQTVTAMPTSTPCPQYLWTKTHFWYSINQGEDWLDNPHIDEDNSPECLGGLTPLFSHEIDISVYPELDTETFYIVFEDVISRLPEYPPSQPELSETIALVSGSRLYQLFTYTHAIAAYESGLRGADLAEALGVTTP